jgi:fimbrial chaperone protein
LVRVAEKPVDGEETYRMLVDELPPPPSNSSVSNVRFVARYSVPIFFTQTANRPQIAWKASLADGKLNLMVRNDGTQHIRISGLKIETPSGISAPFGEGLVGYVLAHSTMRWTAQNAMNGATLGTTIKITAQGNNGPISATAALQTTTN